MKWDLPECKLTIIYCQIINIKYSLFLLPYIAEYHALLWVLFLVFDGCSLLFLLPSSSPVYNTYSQDLVCRNPVFSLMLVEAYVRFVTTLQFKSLVYFCFPTNKWDMCHGIYSFTSWNIKDLSLFLEPQVTQDNISNCLTCYSVSDICNVHCFLLDMTKS